MRTEIRATGGNARIPRYLSFNLSHKIVRPVDAHGIITAGDPKVVERGEIFVAQRGKCGTVAWKVFWDTGRGFVANGAVFGK